ncbi:MAG: hypothetical protein IH940_06210 [Acidobacteria bacterium]|nr:hypothetical protein [Acidobacteriota bacterium]
MYASPFTTRESSTILRAGWRYRRLVVIATLVGLVFGLAYGLVQSSAVTASTNLVLRDASDVDQSIPLREQSGAYERFVRSQALFADSDEVLRRVAVPLNTTVEKIRDRVEATASSGGESLEFKATANDEDEATDLLARHVDAYEEARAEHVTDDTELTSEVLDGAGGDLNEEAQGTLQVEAVQLAIASEIYGNGVAFSDWVSVDEQSQVLSLAVPAAVAALAALAIALLLAALVDDRDPLVLGAYSLIDRFEVPVRGVIPSNEQERPHAYEQLAADLEAETTRRSGADQDMAPILLGVGVGVDQNDTVEVLSETSRRLAASGMSVAIIDGMQTCADLPLNGTAAFSPSSVVESQMHAAPSGGRVTVVRSATEARSLPDYGHDAGLADHIVSLRERFDFIFVGSPGVANSTAAQKMAPHCEQVLLIVPAGTRVQEVNSTAYTLHQAGVELGGFVSTDEASPTKPSHWWSR